MQIATAEAVAAEIGAEVRAARKATSLRQDQLALAAGVSTRAVHQIENGKPTSRIDTVTKVLAVLGLRLDVVSRQPPRARPRP